MNKRIFFTALWVGVLIAGFVSPANAQVGIVGINPMEGTVGTEVTVYGAGFGAKQGEVLIGEEKCKVLEWSDSQITCEVYKPQRSYEYTVTVLRQGDKKAAEPLTFSYFTMQQPKIYPGELVQEGGAVTVLGAFFGDKKGEIRLGYLEGGAGGEVVIESAKITDWSMDAIRFEIPAGLVGKFVLKVSNQVGAGFALLDLGGGTPLVVALPPPPGWPEGNGWESADAPDGIWFKGNFYVFYLLPAEHIWSHPRVYCRIFNTTTHSLDACPGTLMPTIYSDTTPETVVVRDAAGVEKELWLFHVTGSKTILFSRFDGNEWLWIPWAGGVSQTPPVVDWYETDSSNYMPAAVFNPVTRKVTLYITYQKHINFAITSDGVNWVHSGALYPNSEGALSAVYHQGTVNGNPYDTLLAFHDSNNDNYVYYLKDGGLGGIVSQYIQYNPNKNTQLPDLVNTDNNPSGGVAMLNLVKTDSGPDYAELRTLGTNGAWSSPRTIFTFPDAVGFCHYYWDYEGYYSYANGSTTALIYYPDGSRRLMFLYLYQGCGLGYEPRYWKMLDVVALVNP